MGAVQIVAYASILIFIVACVARAIKYARAPLHLRWELYPVAHEKGRAHYGGSIFEEPDWWTKPRQIDRVNELKEMFQEIVFLKGVYHNNRKLWLFSFPFHFGLYLLIGWILLLGLGAVFNLGGHGEGGLSGLVRGLTIATGYGGMLVTVIGAIGLLLRRAGSDELRKFSAPAEYFNLIVFIAVLLLGIIIYWGADPGFDVLRGFTASLLRLQPAAPLTGALQLQILLGMLLIAYIPLTRMVHFVAKYFLYHDVRWSDEPNPRGSKIERRIAQAFNFGVSWNAPHIQTGETWAKVGTEEKR
jgi:nitrate reductase gamma subunit